MKIYLGPAGNCSSAKEGGSLSSFERLKELKLDAQEIEFVRSVYMKNEKAKDVGEAAKRTGIKLSVHAPYYINLANPEQVNPSKKRILDSAERAHYLGASPVVFHPGYYMKLGKKEALDMVRRSCEEMSGALGKKGWDTALGLETTGKVSQFGTVEEILEICGAVKRCVPVIDWAHLYAKHQGKADFRPILKSVTDAGFKKIHTHFSNIEFTDKGERRHLTLGHGQPDFGEVAKVILDSDLEEITIISESPVLEQDSLVMKRDLESLGHRF
jgi:deoxyribonuclease-4